MLQLPIIGAIGETVSNYTTELIQRPGIIQNSIREGWVILSEGESRPLACILLVLAATVLLVYYKQLKQSPSASSFTPLPAEAKDSNVNKDRAYGGMWLHLAY